MKRNIRRRHLGSGLYEQVSGENAASWLLRYQINGRERWLGLGSKKLYTAKEARKRARDAQRQLDSGVDPLVARREARTQEALKAARTITFFDAAKAYHAQHEASWSSPKHRRQFLTTLQQHAGPILKLPVGEIEIDHVLRIIEPIWQTKNQTAARLRGRIEAILDWCTVRKFRQGDNPARWSGHLDQILPAARKIAKLEHHASLPYAELPAFVAELSKRQGTGARALQFLIMTAARTSEVLLARWDEFDFENAVWEIPASRMKARRSHRVPLTDAMVRLLKALPREAPGRPGALVFIGSRSSKPLGKMILPNLVDEILGKGRATPHGMRASFRTWCAEQSNFPREIAEQALAHSVGSAVEQSYQRSDVLEQRGLLMHLWCTHLTTPRKPGAANVVPIGRTAERKLP
jgi:integrase